MKNQLENFDLDQWDEASALDSVVPSYSDLHVAKMLDCDPVSSELSQVSNADFVAAIFRILPERASALVCSKKGDPSQGGWPAVSINRLHGTLPINANNYLNCASFIPSQDGLIKARKDNFAAGHFLMLDDVGSKVPLSRLAEFKPSWLIETSAGNYQAGIILDSPITDHGQLTQLLTTIINAGLCDPGATGPATRWVRLPQGINGKPKYISPSGDAFRCRLVRWAPERRYTVSQIIEGLGLPSLVAPNSAKSNVSQGTTSPPSIPTDEAGQQRILAELKSLLAVLDSDCSYSDWLNVLMGTYHSTNGSDDGLALADTWSSTSNKYKGLKEIEIKWRSFNDRVSNPVTIRTLRAMAASSAKGAAVGVSAPMPSDEEFEQCQTVVVSEDQPQQRQGKVAPHPLGKFSISDDIEALERQMVDQVPLLGNIALMGQATAIFAAPNTGKTLLTLRLLTDAIDKKTLDPKKLFYLNMDDNSSGLVEKVKIASEYGFEMLADGYKGFQSSDFRKAMETMIETSTARGVVIVIDTLKKFVDTMDKARSTDFSKVIRRFCLQGGSVIVLGHTNKNPGANGKKMYAGTTDIVDDFDCAYILDTLKVQPEPGWKVVEFENLKRRGNPPAK